MSHAKLSGKTISETALNYHDFDYAQNPYEKISSIRRSCPLGFSRERFGGFYFATTYEAVKAVFSDFRAFTSTDGAAPDLQLTNLPVDFDPPRHTIWRRVIAGFFSPEAAERERERIRGIVNGLIDSFIEKGVADCVDDFARPLLTATMLPVIGIPAERSATVNYHLRAMGSDQEGGRSIAAQHLQAVENEIISVIHARRSGEGRRNDLLQCLIDEQFEDRKLSDEEVFQTLLPTLFGALDSTSSVISQAILHLSQHPEDKQSLITGEVDWGVAIEEFVRIAAPIQAVRRVSTRAIELDGGTIPERVSVIAMPGAANRDPEKFYAPDKCKISRDPMDHLSFGAGAHVCLGRHYARVMIGEALRGMLHKVPNFSVEPNFIPKFTAGEVRSIVILPIFLK